MEPCVEALGRPEYGAQGCLVVKELPSWFHVRHYNEAQVVRVCEACLLVNGVRPCSTKVFKPTPQCSQINMADIDLVGIFDRSL
jgi:hypothetical protein